MEAVTVAVRVRPFNDREKNLHAECAVQMEENTTVLTDSKSGEVHRFTFDHSYWSFDQTSPHSASQETVFTDIGAGVLDAAWNGFNSSLFAYGQTGSGKSYSMIGGGSPDSRGIIPRVCEEIFTRLAADSETVSSSVRVSFLEIYREAIRDLLNPKTEASQLTVRQHPSVGVYVDGLTKHLVSSYGEVEQLMAQGFAVRTVAATKMNHTSSRSHCAFMIEFNRTVGEGDMQRTIRSSISLIDLAGSERQANTQATGVRLKEACAINKSLSALGNVISALAHNSKVEEEGSGRKRFVPYRESVLTRLLTDSLGGNAKTIMIAAISPASSNHGETLSTLRYADRAKQIKNKPQRNESKQERRIRELEEEIKALRLKLEESGPAADQGEAVDISGLAESKQRLALEQAALKEKLSQSEAIIKDLSEDITDSKAEAMRLAKEREDYLREAGVHTGPLAAPTPGHDEVTYPPCFFNLSPDAMFNGTVMYHLHSAASGAGTTTLGSAPENDITLHDTGINARHAVVALVEESEGGAVSAYIQPVDASTLLINGDELDEARRTPHGFLMESGDFVFFGGKCFLRYCCGALPRVEDGEFDRQLTKIQMRTFPGAQGDRPGDSFTVYDDDIDGQSGLLPQILAVDRLCDSANLISEELGQNVVYSLNIIQRGEKSHSSVSSGVEVVVSFLDSKEVAYWDAAFLREKHDDLQVQLENKRERPADFAAVAEQDSMDPERSESAQPEEQHIDGVSLMSSGILQARPKLDKQKGRIRPEKSQFFLGFIKVKFVGRSARFIIRPPTEQNVREFMERVQLPGFTEEAMRPLPLPVAASDVQVTAATRTIEQPEVGIHCLIKFSRKNRGRFQRWLGSNMKKATSRQEKRAVERLVEQPFWQLPRLKQNRGRFVFFYGAGEAIDSGCDLDDTVCFLHPDWQHPEALQKGVNFYLFYQPRVADSAEAALSREAAAELESQALAHQVDELREENERLKRLAATFSGL